MKSRLAHFGALVLVASILGGCGNDPLPELPQSLTAGGVAASPSAEAAPATRAEGARLRSPAAKPPSAPGRTDIGSVKLPPVAVGKGVPINEGVSVTVEKTQEVDLTARGPGEVAGPGVAVTVTLANNSKSPVNLSGATVNAFVGNTPASPSDSDPAAPFVGELPPGSTATGVYVFGAPDGARGGWTIQIEQNESKYVAVVQP